MPTRRRQRTARVRAIGAAELEHLLHGPPDDGGHLIAAEHRCSLCGLDRERVPDAWRLHRATTMNGWHFPFPPWAAIVFDGERLPERADWTGWSVYDHLRAVVDAD